MSAEALTYDDVLVALGDIVAAATPVHVFIAGQGGALVAGCGGRLLHADVAWVEAELRPVYVARGGDADLAAFFIDGGQEHDRRPCFVMCRSFFETATALEPDELQQGVGAGMYWRALTIFVGGVAINIGVEAIEEAG